MPECDSKKFILSARKFNESLEEIVVKWVKSRIGEPSSDKTIALSGMAFKGQPETSDLRGSSSVYIAKKLKKVGYKISLHDFVANPEEMKSLKLGDVYTNLYEACESANILLVLNNHKKYTTVNNHIAFSYSNRNFEILDSWGVCTELYYCDDVKISTLGNMFI